MLVGNWKILVKKNTLKVNKDQQQFNNIIENIIFCAQQKYIHTGLEQLDGE